MWWGPSDHPLVYLPVRKLTEDLKGSASHALSSHRAEHPLTSKKMAIPRLAEGLETFSTPGRFHRRHVSRACESCRQRKTKCTGDKSGCRNCREAGIICCYTDGKREKSKRWVWIWLDGSVADFREIGTPRQLASLEAKIRTYEDALKNLSSRFGITSEQLMNLALTVVWIQAPRLALVETISFGPLEPVIFPSSSLFECLYWPEVGRVL